LPLLKKDDFETALYSLVELGTTTIQLIATQKTQRSWAGEKELDRCQRIMIAAAEQSKNFIIPTLIPPIHLTEYLKKITENEHPKIYFDPQGSAGLALLNNLAQQKAKHYMLMVGPEGDLTQSEKELLQAKSFYFCQLTPTVLRSVSAVILGAGIMRTLMRKN
jgi:16S rRNA (uracil1498-N3)-methyltransferase